jgi:hypothetical protein
VSTEIRCDGCGCKLGNDRHPNYWKCAIEGDTIRKFDGSIAEGTGLTAQGNRQYKIHLDSADLCIPCMSKTQEETT